MADNKIKRKELEELLKDIEDGAELCAIKGMCGWALNPNITTLIAHLIAGFLERHPDEGVYDGDTGLD